MPKYLSSSRGEIDTAEMNTVHITNAISKMRREGFVSSNEHRRAIMEGNAFDVIDKRINKNLDALLEELKERS